MLIGTDADKKSGKINGRNCKGEEKIKRLNKVIKDYEIENFYSDSTKADLPLFKVTNNGFVVKHGVLSEFREK